MRSRTGLAARLRSEEQNRLDCGHPPTDPARESEPRRRGRLRARRLARHVGRPGNLRHDRGRLQHAEPDVVLASKADRTAQSLAEAGLANAYSTLFGSGTPTMPNAVPTMTIPHERRHGHVLRRPQRSDLDARRRRPDAEPRRPGWRRAANRSRKGERGERPAGHLEQRRLELRLQRLAHDLHAARELDRDRRAALRAGRHLHEELGQDQGAEPPGRRQGHHEQLGPDRRVRRQDPRDPHRRRLQARKRRAAQPVHERQTSSTGTSWTTRRAC